jgi:lipopolysaccharide cholinephosphotransferase
MNNLQAAQLDMLREVDRICAEHDIPYSLAYGTALGAVRHKGFIPWDDDIDIIMLRKDFERFEAIWKDNAPGHLFLATHNSEEYYTYPFAKVRNSNTTFVETGCEHLDINHGVFIDIFIIDYIPRSKSRRAWQLFCAEMVWILARKYTPGEGLRGLARKLICAPFTKKARQKALRYFEKKLACPYGDSACTANLNYGTGLAKKRFPNDLLREVVRVPFENDAFMLMKDWDSLLRVQYGDYMTPPPAEQRAPAHPYAVYDLERPYRTVLKDVAKS